MKCWILALLILVVVPTAALADDFLDTFTYPDGTQPPEWIWTGDPQNERGRSLRFSLVVRFVSGCALIHTTSQKRKLRPGSPTGSPRKPREMASPCEVPIDDVDSP